jgi:hypothetical protein
MHEYVYNAIFIFKLVFILCYICLVVMCLNMGSGYIINCYQREDSNIGQVWAKDQSKFDKFLLPILFYDKFGENGKT